jgi:hypothetical protein
MLHAGLQPSKCLQFCWARLPGKAPGQGSWARLHAMVQCQYAESMVKLVDNAVFSLMCPQEQQEQQSKT